MENRPSGKNLQSGWPAGSAKNGCKNTLNDWLSVWISFLISLFRGLLASTAVAAILPGVNIEEERISKIKSKQGNKQDLKSF